MRLTQGEIRSNAIRFAKEWEDAANERAEAQSFWTDLFGVYGIKRRSVASFEEKVRNLEGHYSRIDVFYAGVMLGEHKSRGEDLTRAQSQAFDYVQSLTRAERHSEIPQFIVLSDFETIVVFDLDSDDPAEPVARFPTAKLHENTRHLGFLAGQTTRPIDPEDPGQFRGAASCFAPNERLLPCRFACFVERDPFSRQSWHPLDHFGSHENLVDIPHVEHVDDATEIRSPACPPCVMGINHQIVLAVNSLRLSQLLKFHAVQKRLVYTVSHTTSESGRVVVLFDLPHSYRVLCRRKCTVYSARKRAKRHATLGKGRQLPRIEVTWQAREICIDEHSNHRGQIGWLLLFSFLLVHRHRQRRSRLTTHLLECGLRLFCVHKQRLHHIIQDICPVSEVVDKRPSHHRGLISLDYMRRTQRHLFESPDDHRHVWNKNLLGAASGVPKVLTDAAHIRPEVLGLIKVSRVRFQLASSSSRLIKSTNWTPNTRQIFRSSRTSRRRSPDSYRLTNDCGSPSLSAKSAWRRPASMRICRTSDRKHRISEGSPRVAMKKPTTP